MALFSCEWGDFPDDKDAPNIFVFLAMMSAAVAKRRGGKNSDYLSECGSFVCEVVGQKLSIAEPLPPEFDWRPAAAVELAQELMLYDD